ncbi:serine hydrolase domain-containing protein [Ketogulonicigenium vulgare]|uniref:serine hydrolase domain-containing protein n=1 Tax=Ketogulonicigenium vulgare TaxID=92945 RepID=UPI0023590AFB|nr:serine hydrolase [Ketogulonicigenium vulgare]
MPSRRHFIAAGLALPMLMRPAFAQSAPLSALLDEAEGLAPLRAITIAQNGETIVAQGYNGHSAGAATNIKSASKPIIGALVGIAVARGLLEGADQPIAPLLAGDLPANPDPRLNDVTIGHLLTMRAGLGRTSGANYGNWVSSGNWVRNALARPFDDEPGGRMLYSTGSTHLLSAILTRVSGQSTLSLAREWLGVLPDFDITGWERDPQGIYLGGNEMAMTPASLLAFGELYRNGGRAPDGTQLIPAEWVRASWQSYTRSVYSGDGYGYGWFLRELGGEQIAYAWGYGGQMLYIVPELALSVVMVSDADPRPTTIADRDNLHDLSARMIAAVRAAA